MTYEEMQDFKPFSSKYFAFTTVMFNPDDGLIYCGTTAYDAEVMWTFDPATKKFESLHYPEAEGAERYDIKVHRSLVLDDGMIYGATAGLHPPQSRLKAKGGKVFRLDPKTKKFEILGIPVKYDYIQSIAMDRKRKIIYGFTWPVPKFFRLDVLTKQSTDFDFVGNQPHIPAVDDEGTCWGQGGMFVAGALLSYHPDTGLKYHKESLGALLGGDTEIDGMINGGDGFIYIGTTGGALIRLDPKNVSLKYLGHPCPGNRLAGLAIGKDGLIYGAGGSGFKTYVFAYDRENEKSYDLGPLFDPDLNDSCYIPHHATITDDGVLYTGDTDTPRRCGFLWEVKVKW
jgi:outer membrane protein assembly factor BamB